MCERVCVAADVWMVFGVALVLYDWVLRRAPY